MVRDQVVKGHFSSTTRTTSTFSVVLVPERT